MVIRSIPMTRFFFGPVLVVRFDVSPISFEFLLPLLNFEPVELLP